eukprot:c18375_g1_i2.p1 GENE.c18375_g1_i2~~c18375_g1_i2.p1  ORF type:complete len:739 (+),score=44.26 c18375_g1_i2:778-2994(+)
MLGPLQHFLVRFFYETSLYGTIPTVVGNFPFFRELRWDVTLSGTIPSEIGRARMSHFVLFNSSLTGTIPTQMGLFGRAATIVLHDNDLFGSIPSTLGMLTTLFVLVLRNNKLTGTIPLQLGALTELENLDLSGNGLNGGIPTGLGDLILLQYLMLHRNRLGGSIPSQLGLLTRLSVTSLYGNRLTGSLPPLHHARGSLTLLFSNRLSCPLPTQKGESSRTLVALGNSFPLVSFARTGAEDWLFDWDSQSTHLFVGYPAPWVRLLCMLGTALVLCVVWWTVRRKWPNPPHLWAPCAKLCLIGLTFGIAHAAVLLSSRSIHQCADPLSQMNLSEPTELSGVRGWMFTSCILYCGFGVCGVAWLRRCNSSSVSATSERLLFAERSSHTSVRSVCRLGTIWWKILLFVAWFISLCVLNIPSFLSLALTSLPANNSLNIDASVAFVLRWCASPFLVFVCETLIPKLCVLLVRQWSQDNAQIPSRPNVQLCLQPLDSKPSVEATDTSQDSDPAKSDFQHRSSTSELILASQIMVLVLLPIIAEVFFAEHCMGVTRGLWHPCSGGEDFDIPGTVLVRDAHRNWLHFFVLRHEGVCQISWTVADSDMCVRQVIASSSSLIISKVVVQILLTMVQALALEFLRWIACTGAFWDRCARLCQPQEETRISRSIVSLMLIGFAFGGVAPVVWFVVLLAVISTRLVPRQRIGPISMSQTTRLKIPGLLFSGPIIQVVLFVWYFATAELFET